MKKNIKFLCAALLFLAFGCRKENSKTLAIQTNDGSTPEIEKITYVYKDTATIHPTFHFNNTNSKLIVNSISTSLIVNYVGSNNYQLTAKLNGASGLITYTLIKNGAQYEAEGSYTGSSLTITRNLGPGIYWFTMGTSNAGTLNTPSVTIVVQPTAPSGLICLFRYFNPTNGQHVCTSDWEELGSASQNFIFDKVIGYISSFGSGCCGAPTLKPICRYYNSTTGAHLTTDETPNIAGWTYEKRLGYSSIHQTSTMGRALTRWTNASINDHFVCCPPEVPTGTSYTQDPSGFPVVGNFVIGYIQ